MGGHPLSSLLLRTALLEGDVKVIKIILAAAKGSEGTSQVDQTKLDALINALPKERGGELTKSKRCRLVSTLFGEELGESSLQGDQDSHTALLELQVAAANPTLWTAFCQHSKLGMPEEFQSNWLNQKGEDEVFTNAFVQAREINFENLLQLEPNIKGRSLNSFHINNDIILKFINKNQSSLNIKITANDNKWEGSEVFRS